MPLRHKVLTGAFMLLFTATHTAAAKDDRADRGMRHALGRFLRITDESVASANYKVAWIDLNGDGLRDAVVYFPASGWCGTGGCSTLVVRQTARGFAVIGNTPATRLPIRVLRTRHNGWRDLSTWQQGGGNLEGCTAAIEFNGWRYRARGCWPPGEPGTTADGPVIIAAKHPDP